MGHEFWVLTDKRRYLIEMLVSLGVFKMYLIGPS